MVTTTEILATVQAAGGGLFDVKVQLKKEVDPGAWPSRLHGRITDYGCELAELAVRDRHVTIWFESRSQGYRLAMMIGDSDEFIAESLGS